MLKAVQPKQQPDAAELINRVNFGLRIGNFEMDVEDGVLQYRTSIDIEGEPQQLTPLLVKHLVYANVLTVDKYLPAFRALLEDGHSPYAAIMLVED